MRFRCWVSVYTTLLVVLVIGCDRRDPVASSATAPALAAALSPGSGSTPSAPSGTAAVAMSDTRIDVSWQDNSSNESGFEVHRSTSGPSGAFALLASTSADVTSYNDAGLTGATQYCYRVRAFRITGRKTSYSPFSGVSCALTQPSTPPLAPQSVNARPLGSAYVEVSWLGAGAPEDGFRVERSVDAGQTWVVAGTVGQGITSLVNGGLTSEQPVCYRVVAFNIRGDSPPSDLDCTTPPAPPTDLVDAGFDPQTGGSILTWTDNSAVEDGYEVWRCDLYSEYEYYCGVVASLPANTSSFDQFYWDYYGAYAYVVAVKDGGSSDPSNGVTPPVP